MEIAKTNRWGITSLPIKTRLFMAFIITISSLVVLWSLGLYEGGPTYFWDHSNTSSSLQGAPGEAVYFNYTIETEGGRIVHHAEFRDIRCEWSWDVIPSKISVNPGERRTLSLKIEIPRDAVVGESISIYFEIYTWDTLHGIDFGGYGRDSTTLTLTVIEERGTNEDISDWERGEEHWECRTDIPDVVYFVISLYLILFIQALVLFLIPAYLKHKKRNEDESDKP
ncbi:MAG: hypothetical protein JSV56_03190 [Methanomassiliicoccales archaeon]|nr:MAG: hypothetical protein JSV56_03190 [Methanomassiliicoccales archaeon]